MTALARYVVLVPGINRPVHVYAPSRAEALQEGANSIGLVKLPEGSTAVPIADDHVRQPRAA